MKIALVHDQLDQVGGAERVLTAMHEVFPDAPIFTMIHDSRKTYSRFENMDVRTSFVQKVPLGRRKFKWFLPWMPLAIEQFDLTDYDLVLSSSSAYAKGVITRPETIHISYCYTPTRYLWNETFHYREELNQSRLVKAMLPLVLYRLRKWDRMAADRVDHFVSVSSFISDRIRKYYRRESEVIYPPVDVSDFKIADKIGDYFVIVSRLRPYKRVDLAVQVFNALGLPLKVVGAGEEEAKLRKMAEPNIEFLGYVSDDEKAELLSKCQALIHPQEEDLGITPLEAMASGRPVIALGKGGALETVVDGETGIFFREQTPASLAKAVRSFNSDDFDSREIRRHVGKYDVECFKDNLRKCVDSIVARNQKGNGDEDRS